MNIDVREDMLGKVGKGCRGVAKLANTKRQGAQLCPRGPQHCPSNHRGAISQQYATSRGIRVEAPGLAFSKHGTWGGSPAAM